MNRPLAKVQQVGEERAFLAREGGAIVRYAVVGTRRVGYDIRNQVVVEMPARTTTESLPHATMYKRRQLTLWQYGAAVLLETDFIAAAEWPEGSIDWERVEDALSIRGGGGATRISWPPPRPRGKIKRAPSGYGPPGGGCLDAQRRVSRVLREAGMIGSHLLVWVVGEGRTCQEWVNVRNAGPKAEIEGALAAAAVTDRRISDLITRDWPMDAAVAEFYLRNVSSKHRARADEARIRLVRVDYATALLRDALEAAGRLYAEWGFDVEAAPLRESAEN